MLEQKLVLWTGIALACLRILELALDLVARISG